MNSSPQSRVVLGKLLTIGGKPEEFAEKQVTDAVRAKADRGVLSIKPGRAGHQQIRALK